MNETNEMNEMNIESSRMDRVLLLEDGVVKDK